MGNLFDDILMFIVSIPLGLLFIVALPFLSFVYLINMIGCWFFKYPKPTFFGT